MIIMPFWGKGKTKFKGKTENWFRVASRSCGYP
jgi:hypothetical protein